MPRFDGTGPMGRGPRSGAGLGRCRVSSYCDQCPFKTQLLQETKESLEQKEQFLEKLLAEVKTEKSRKKHASEECKKN